MILHIQLTNFVEYDYRCYANLIPLMSDRSPTWTFSSTFPISNSSFLLILPNPPRELDAAPNDAQDIRLAHRTAHQPDRAADPDDHGPQTHESVCERGRDGGG